MATSSRRRLLARALRREERCQGRIGIVTHRHGCATVLFPSAQRGARAAEARIKKGTVKNPHLRLPYPTACSHGLTASPGSAITHSEKPTRVHRRPAIAVWRSLRSLPLSLNALRPPARTGASAAQVRLTPAEAPRCLTSAHAGNRPSYPTTRRRQRQPGAGPAKDAHGAITGSLRNHETLRRACRPYEIVGRLKHRWSYCLHRPHRPTALETPIIPHSSPARPRKWRPRPRRNHRCVACPPNPARRSTRRSRTSRPG